MKILVVEDSMLCRKLVAKYLGEQLPEAHIITATNGAEGYRFFQKCTPDLMVIDLLMPQMDGIQLLKTVKQEKPDTKVVVLSADVQKITQEEVLQLGANIFLPKPFTQNQAKEIADLFQA